MLSTPPNPGQTDPMTEVTVFLPAALQPLANGAHQLALAGESVADVLEQLGEHRPQVGRRVLTRDGQLRRHVNIFADDEDIRALAGTATPLAGRQSLTIVPSVAGG